jgi:hypothetical protein
MAPHRLLSSADSQPSIAIGGTETMTWSGIGNPTSTDWIALLPRVPVHSPSWMYVSCSQTAGSAQASGLCPFALPTSLAAGN